MTEDLGWVGTTRRSNYVGWLGLGLLFMFGSLYATFMTGRTGPPVFTVAGYGLAVWDLITLLGVPAGAVIAGMAEASARSRYYFGQDEIVKQVGMPFFSKEERMAIADIEGASWNDSIINGAAGTVRLYEKVDGSSDMRLGNLRRFDDVTAFLKENVEDLVYVSRRGGGAGAGGAAAGV